MSQLNEYLSDEYAAQWRGSEDPYGTLCLRSEDPYPAQGGKSETLFDTDTTSMITLFPEAIFDCSDRFKHIFNISTFPATLSNKLVQTNGPMILIIKSKGIATGMRFSDQRSIMQSTCNQTIQSNDNYAGTIANIFSNNLNQYSVGFPFILTGNSSNILGNELKNIVFKTVDV